MYCTCPMPTLIKMANYQGGYNCEFVETPPKAIQYECPVCLLILRQPYQVSCCGYGFCKVCIDKIKGRCPCCKTEDFDHFHDKRLKRSLSELKVCCSYENEGCSWSGELGDLDEHLNSDPLQEKQLKGCKFAQIQCLHCSMHVKRVDIQEHQDDCPKRPFSCEHCEEMTKYQQMLVGYEEKLKKLEQDLKPKVERLTEDLQTLLQPKRKAVKRRWKKLTHVAYAIQRMQNTGGDEEEESETDGPTRT